ncbi:MAG: D-alanyl-D-alanine carboxypeptidase, partial [Cyclobacteriaceae bacterium]|nr:D-alanyl-D-alanine carboxypeptidase [Cyclobacteriaceae bacterium]
MLNTTRRIVLLSLCSLLALSNRGLAQETDLKSAMEALERKFQHHAGLMLYDPEKRQVLFDYKSDKYFTPASNTKIFTLYTSFQVLGDSIPGLYYVEKGDSLIIWGTGDPSLLYENVVQGKVLEFLQNSTKDIYLSFSNFHDQHYGPNWAWDDFSYYYQVEKTSFPLYGNYLILERDSGDVEPVVHNRVMGKYLRQKGGDSDHS